MNEHDANRALLEAAELIRGPGHTCDMLEQTQRMPVYDRRRRQAEARTQWVSGACQDAIWAELSKQREVDDYVDGMIRRGLYGARP